MTHTTAAQRLRGLWFTLAWAVTLALLILGFTYLFGGLGVVATARPYAVIAHQLPGGMRTHGGVMASVGFVLCLWLCPTLCGLPDPRRGYRKAMLAGGAYLLLVVLSFAGAPVAGGVFSPSAVVLWMIPTVALFALGLFPPPTRSEMQHGEHC